MQEQNTNIGQEQAHIEPVRPTKKQRELLIYLETFIAEHGYSPSYREIMAGCGYNSVATVALHVGNLIKRGHVIKRTHSARSLEVVHSSLAEAKTISTNAVADSEEKWLVEKIEHLLKEQEEGAVPEKSALEDIATLLQALKILGLDGAAQALRPQLAELEAQLR